MKTVRDAFFDVARKLGLTTVFGNPGSTEESFLQDFPSDFNYVLGLQEASVIAMADAYSQIKRTPVLVNLHTSAGTGNAMGNIETAFQNKVPMIITAGQQTREMLLIEPYLTNVNPETIAKPFVKWAYQPARPEDVPGALMRAYAIAVQPPAGPVYLSLPMDDMDKPFSKVVPIRKVPNRLGADPLLFQDVIETLNKAKNPVLIFGGEIDHYTDGWENAQRLAQRLRCPVWAGPKEGKPGFPEDHPLYQGVLKSSIADLNKQLQGHDVILVIGAPVFRYYPFVAGEYIPEGAELIHVSDDLYECAKAPVGESILADPASACRVLTDLLGDSNREYPSPRKKPQANFKETIITPDFLFHTLNSVRPKDCIFVEESPSTLSNLHSHLPTKESRSYLSMSSGVLGYGISGAVGAAIAEKELGSNRKVIAIVGDGSANYVIQSLWNAAQLKLPILFLILKNKSYNVLKSFAKQQETPNVPGLNIPGIDFGLIAMGYGVQAHTVAHPGELKEQLEAALTKDFPFLLEVDTDPTVEDLL